MKCSHTGEHCEDWISILELCQFREKHQRPYVFTLRIYEDMNDYLLYNSRLS
jgi:hypothetical protein